MGGLDWEGWLENRRNHCHAVGALSGRNRRMKGG